MAPLGKAQERGRWARVALAGLALLMGAAALAACDSGSAKPPVATTAPKGETPPTSGASIDVQITSDKAYLTMAIKGTQGLCTFPTRGLPNSYKFNGHQYPQLGPGGAIQVFGSMVVAGAGTVGPNVKVFVNGAGALSSTTGAGLSFDADGRGVRLDADMVGGYGESPDLGVDVANTIRMHITGTIRCT